VLFETAGGEYVPADRALQGAEAMALMGRGD
jgi:hypothetical protein